MEFAEQRAARAGYRAVRLDAFSGNPAALRLYDRLGYRRCGTARFRGRGFVLFEKVLERDSEDDVVPR
jgi:RimJ/RimL family protein N-acetyltransferase